MWYITTLPGCGLRIISSFTCIVCSLAHMLVRQVSIETFVILKETSLPILCNVRI